MTTATNITWNGVAKTGSTFASDLGWKPGQWPRDLFIKEERPDNPRHPISITCYFKNKVIRNSEMELLGWQYTDACSGWTINIFND